MGEDQDLRQNLKVLFNCKISWMQQELWYHELDLVEKVIVKQKTLNMLKSFVKLKQFLRREDIFLVFIEKFN
nr:hypothetical protein Iba_chr02aCG1540 [Ipomoea batatas]GMC62141.1 hypothetical protein Iba_chr02cCG1070 [Ipomoea batatas]